MNMTKAYHVSDLAADLNLKILNGIYEDRVITTGYCCDMLSWAMSRLSDTSCWFTILNSMNVIAVASLSGCPAIVLTENVQMEEEVLQKAAEEGIPVLSSDRNTYESAAELSRALVSRG
jgi:predicted transcriptional regulator